MMQAKTKLASMKGIERKPKLSPPKNSHPTLESSITKAKKNNHIRIILKVVALLLPLVAAVNTLRSYGVIDNTVGEYDEVFGNDLIVQPPIRAAHTMVKNNSDSNCLFQHSSLYRSIYVYEHPSQGPDSMKAYPDKNATFDPWPWIAWNEKSKEGRWAHYVLGGQADQFTLEIILNDLFTHPGSCLRSFDPKSAKLFFVPFLHSVAGHQGKVFQADFSTTPHAKAMLDASDGNYTNWKEVWGLTDEYWSRRDGADHIVVQSEPCHGFTHPRMKRGSHHYVYTQKMLSAPIVVNVEISQTFLNMYPKCAAKNIVSPYPNPDGRNFNGGFDDLVSETLKSRQITLSSSREISQPSTNSSHMMHYSAGNHGECRKLRSALQTDFECSNSKPFFEKFKKLSYPLAMRIATFCPCPGGDSPSAKRMYDAVIMGCIPVILSQDFVWGFSTEYDPDMILNPNDYSIRLNSSNFDMPHYEKGKCSTRTIGFDTKPLEEYLLQNVNKSEIQRLQSNLIDVGRKYSFYRVNQTRPDELLRLGHLPDGEASFEIVRALEQRVGGTHWKACQEELKTVNYKRQPGTNKC